MFPLRLSLSKGDKATLGLQKRPLELTVPSLAELHTPVLRASLFLGFLELGSVLEGSARVLQRGLLDP